jgi:glycine oxidase
MRVTSSNTCDVAIIGSGVIGLSLAWSLAQRGVSVTLFGPQDIKTAASYWAAGMLAPCFEAKPTEELLLSLNLQAKAVWPDFAQALEKASNQSIGYRASGTLHVAITEDERARLTHTFTFQKNLGLPLNTLTREAWSAREPYVSPQITQAVWSPHDHHVDPRLVLSALQNVCTRSGVHRVYGTVDSLILKKNAVIGLNIHGEHWTVGHTVLAGGACSPTIQGLPSILRPPIHPVKGQSLVVHMNPQIPLCTHVIRGCGIYMVPHASGRLIVGATSEEKGDDASSTFGAHLALMEAAWRLFPGIEELPLGERCVGFRPGTRDGAPILGPSSPTEGIAHLTYATGHYRHGVLLAPLTAKWLTQWICDHHMPKTMASFSLARFQNFETEKEKLYLQK